MVKRSKKLLSAILTAAMVLSIAPVSVMAEEVDAADEVIVIDEVSEAVYEVTETADEVTDLIADDADSDIEEVKIDEYNPTNSWDPNGGKFNAELLINETNGYINSEKVTKLVTDGVIDGSYDFHSPIYYNYYAEGDNYSYTFQSFDNLAVTKEGYRFVGWFSEDEEGNQLVFDLSKKLTRDDFVDRVWKAHWVKEGALLSISANDVTLKQKDGKNVLANVKINPDVFDDVDLEHEDLYIMFIMKWPGDPIFQWTRWGKTDYTTPITPDTKEVNFTGYYYEEPVTSDTTVTMEMFYFTCEKGSFLENHKYESLENWGKITKTGNTYSDKAKIEVPVSTHTEKITMNDGKAIEVKLDVQDANGNPIGGIDLSKCITSDGKKVKLAAK